MTGSYPRLYVPRWTVRRDGSWPADSIDSRGRSALYHQCYKRCGFRHDDLKAVDAHEDRCTKATQTEET